MIFYSSVSSDLKKKTLYRGTFVAAIGIIPIAWAIVALSHEVIYKWGIYLFIFWLAMVVFGLQPYQRLKKAEQQPHKLEVLKNEFVISFYGKDPFSIPIKSIDAISYLKGKNEYGLLLELKKALPSGKLKLYLPYFSERTFKSLFERYRASGSNPQVLDPQEQEEP
jgi:hypothetical protein